ATLVSTNNGAVLFSSKVDGGKNLTVNTGGATTFGGHVGGTAPLTSLSHNTGGTTVLGTTAAITVNTTGNQTYGDDVSLAQDATLVSTNNGAVLFSSKVDGGKNLTVNTGGA